MNESLDDELTECAQAVCKMVSAFPQFVTVLCAMWDVWIANLKLETAKRNLDEALNG